MRFAPIKEQAQLDLQTIHRIRQRLVGPRTALINQLRAILLERGIIPQRRRVLDRQLPGLLADEGNGFSPRIRLLIEDIRAEWREFDTRIKVLDCELIATAKPVDNCRRLCEIPGNRRPECDGADGGCEQRRCLRQGPRHGAVAGSDAP